jgi:transcriptional regulator with XRE-family HTH domain
MTPPKISFGSFIRLLREQREWTQEELQAKSDLGAGTISNIEGDAGNPKQTTIEKLARAFNLSPGALQSQYEAYAQATTPAPDNVLQMPTLRRAEDFSIDHDAFRTAQRITRLSPAARHAIEGVLMAFEEFELRRPEK